MTIFWIIISVVILIIYIFVDDDVARSIIALIYFGSIIFYLGDCAYSSITKKESQLEKNTKKRS